MMEFNIEDVRKLVNVANSVVSLPRKRPEVE